MNKNNAPFKNKGNIINNQIHNNKLPTKQESILKLFLSKIDNGINAEEAFFLGSTCLNTDVSKFEKIGLKFNRKFETLPRKKGGKKRYMRYWLDPGSIELATKTIELWVNLRSSHE